MRRGSQTGGRHGQRREPQKIPSKLARQSCSLTQKPRPTKIAPPTKRQNVWIRMNNPTPMAGPNRDATTVITTDFATITLLPRILRCCTSLGPNSDQCPRLTGVPQPRSTHKIYNQKNAVTRPKSKFVTREFRSCEGASCTIDTIARRVSHAEKAVLIQAHVPDLTA